MMNLEKKIYEFVMDEIFSDRPCKETDWDLFMNNESTIIPDDFEVCNLYEYENAESLRNLMQSMFYMQHTFCESLYTKSVWQIFQTDVRMTYPSFVCFGTFNTLSDAHKAAEAGFGKIYPKFSEFLWKENNLYWHCQDLDFCIVFKNVAIDNNFGEV